jgi:hypothetical protein
MPMNVFRHPFILACHFLYLVLTKNTLSGVIGFHKVRYRLSFAYSYKCNVSRERGFYFE